MFKKIHDSSPNKSALFYDLVFEYTMHTHGIIALQISIQTLVIYQEKAIRSNTNENISCTQYRIAHPRIVHYL